MQSQTTELTTKARTAQDILADLIDARRACKASAQTRAERYEEYEAAIQADIKNTGLVSKLEEELLKAVRAEASR